MKRLHTVPLTTDRKHAKTGRVISNFSRLVLVITSKASIDRGIDFFDISKYRIESFDISKYQYFDILHYIDIFDTWHRKFRYI